MRSIATLRSPLWSPRLPITQPARAGLGGTNGSAEDQSTPCDTRGRFESPQRRSQFCDFAGRLARKTNGASSHVVARTANGASSDVVLGGLSPSSISDAMTSPPCCRTRTAARMWYLEPSCILLVACMTVEWPLTWACSKSTVRFTGSWAVLRPLVAAGRRPRAVCGSCSLCCSPRQRRTRQVLTCGISFAQRSRIGRISYSLAGGRRTVMRATPRSRLRFH